MKPLGYPTENVDNAFPLISNYSQQNTLLLFQVYKSTMVLCIIGVHNIPILNIR